MTNPDIDVSVAIPVKNEEANLAKCLERLGRFKEIIIIDSGSEDKTQDIGRKFGARIVNFNWDGKYPKKRNWFLMNEPPTQPWVLFLDADEFINDDFCDAVVTAIKDDKLNGFWLNYDNYFQGGQLKHGVTQTKLALFRVGTGLYEKIEESFWSTFDMEIHEHPIIQGNIGKIHTPIEHKDYKGLSTFIRKHNEYAQWEAKRYVQLQEDDVPWQHFTKRQKFKYSHITKFWYPWFYFLFTYVVKVGFLDGSTGFHYAAYKAWYFQTIRLLIREQNET